MQVIPVDELRFPSADASEIHADEDKALFASLFSVPSQLHSLVDSARYFIIGEKGTGKTAIATYFSNSLHPNIAGGTIRVEKEDYDNFQTFNKTVPLSFADYSEIWETTVTLLLCTYLLDRTIRRDESIPDAGRLLLRVLDELNQRNIYRITEAFDLICWNRIAFFNALKASFPEFVKGDIPQHFRTYVRVIKNALAKVLEQIGHQIKYLIFIDGVDTRPFFDQDTVAGHTFHFSCLAGLVTAVQRLNSQVLSKRFNHRIRAILLIRPDIMERVNLQNSAHVIRDNAIVINWFTFNNGYRESEFFRLADNMLSRQQLRGAHSPVLGQCWDAYFPEGIRTFGKRVREPFVFFLQQSFYRPRDLVFFFRTIQGRMNKIGRGHERKLDLHVFQAPEARTIYSDYLLAEIKDSILFYHDEDAYVAFRNFFDLLQDHMTDGEFTYEDFCKVFDELRKQTTVGHAESSPIISSADSFLQFLYEFNILGFLTIPKNKPQWWSFCTQARSPVNMRPRVRLRSRYRINFGVGRALYPHGVP